ncbi:unnamed protein product [Cuscuta epithymum]|uniref:Serpin domain-containing protein n=1 Tax=Cuscuta epithymum TaxID=186058 RepID=A0AAV0D0U3_9ASTE|nr:unnamed protein product [Cuscuta epithymum]
MAKLSEVIAKQADASVTLTKHVFLNAVKAGDRNVALSPLSVNVVMGMVAAGSKGQTRDSLLSFLNSDSTADFDAFATHAVTKILSDASHSGGLCITAANGAWVEKTVNFNPPFKHLLENSYEAVCQSVDFRHQESQVVKDVNLWFEKKTCGLIKRAVDIRQFSPETILILANAIYFRGVWDDEFDKRCTRDTDFYLMNKTSVQAPFMSSSHKYRYVKAFKDFKTLRLPYKSSHDGGRQFSMFIILPNAIDGLFTLMDVITKNSGFLERHAPNKLVRVGRFRIPKFKINHGFDVSKTMWELGVQLSGDDMREMVVNLPKGISIIPIITHKCVVDVHERGTEAVAFTGLGLGGCSRRIEEEKIDFVADHPFAFFIREDVSGAVVFAGAVLNPLL